MNIPKKHAQNLHRWDLTPTEAIALQRQLALKVREEILPEKIDAVAGVDCAYLKEEEQVIAVAVLCDARTMKVEEEKREMLPCTFPYVPGLLSFREAPAVIQALDALSLKPDLLLCDAHGVAHPRRFGLASHVGLWQELPSIGVAKSRLCGTHREPGRKRGCRTQLRDDSEVIGTVLRTRTGVKPLYISIGHAITLEDAVKWTLRCTRGFRLPEPTRQAHLRVTAWKKELLK